MKHDEGFKKSSFSESGVKKAPDCVEVKRGGNDIKVRNSRFPNNDTLSFTSEEWDAFLQGVRNNEFNV